ncbi:sugar ABC transporter permease [Halobacteria archaeon AArc-curdl1]|uniref:Sugar ABC transporter permease n=1 Tax=Natronosalvus hydrolyticus TaxID=2979988 RepID=A0AAP2Z9E2_9EURY|nr:sugar ABC transporter permease [Halobacteria archaeon AArc-curdl1]
MKMENNIKRIGDVVKSVANQLGGRRVSRLYTRLMNRIEVLPDDKFAYLMLTPAFILMTIIAFWPITYTLQMSVREDHDIETVGEFVGLENYYKILTNDANLLAPFFDITQPFYSSLTVTIIITIGAVVLSMVLGFAQALILNETFKGQSVMRVIVILPWAVPIVIQGMIFRLMFTPGAGVGVEWLDFLGFANATSPLAYSRESTFIVILAEAWKHSAFVAIILLAGLQSINRELYKVADVAGASRWQRFKMITFPLIIPAIFVALIFRTIESMRIYGTVVAVSGCGDVTVLTCSVINEFSRHNYGTSSAVAVILALIIASIVAVYLTRFAQRGGISQ